MLQFLSGICVSMFILVEAFGFCLTKSLQSELKLFKCYTLPQLSLCINPLPSFATQAPAQKVRLKSRAPSLPGATTPQLESLAARPMTLCLQFPQVILLPSEVREPQKFRLARSEKKSSMCSLLFPLPAKTNTYTHI